MTGPVLTTQRLELWQPQQSDLADLFDLTLAEETRRFLGSFVPTEMDAFARLLRNAALHPTLFWKRLMLTSSKLMLKLAWGLALLQDMPMTQIETAISK